MQARTGGYSIGKSHEVRSSRAFYSDPGTVAVYDAKRLDSRRGQMRYRLQWGMLLEMLPAPPATVAEVGSGTGIFSEQMSRRGYTVVPIDPSLKMLHACRDRFARSSLAVDAAQGSGLALPLASASLDATCCLNVLSHIVEPMAIVGEMVRVTRPGGSIVFNFTNLSSAVGKLIHYVVNPVRRLARHQRTHTRYHSAGELLAECSRLPVVVERVTGLFPFDWRLYPKNAPLRWMDSIEAWERWLGGLDRVRLFQQGWVHLRRQAE